MNCQFSEKFYEILFDCELLKNNPNAYVYIPSQKAEKELGYDIYFKDGNKKVVFIQFKVPYTYNSKKNKYRFRLHSKNKYKQHNTLCDYNTKSGKILAVYYAPVFVNMLDLNNYFNNGQIKMNSKCFLPLKCNRISKKQVSSFHYVEYDRTVAVKHSEEGEIMESINFEEKIRQLESLDLNQFKKEIKGLKSNITSNCCFIFLK